MLTILQPTSPHEAAGMIALLAQFDSRHAGRRFHEVFNEIHACVMHRQFAIVQMTTDTAAGKKNTPVGYVLWAGMSFAASAIYGKNIRTLSPSEYKSGDETWIIQFSSPFGMKEEIFQCVQENIALLGKNKRKLAIDLFENVPHNLLKPE